ncbi:MAG TPA: type II toxin-antitoxin system VapC family toxin [Rhodocyclaceae bacterium]
MLDTHALVWLLAGNQRLGAKARKTIQKAARDNDLFVSAISPWEIAVLVSKGRLVLDRDVGEWVQTALALPGIRLEPLSPEVAVASTRLPGQLHSDPADRIIAATARHLGAALITADSQLLGYGAAGHLKAIEAER